MKFPLNSFPKRIAVYLLISLTLLLYVRLLGFNFVTWDDHAVIVHNPVVLSGFSSWEGIFDIGTNPRFMPLSWISFKTVTALFGMDPAFFHASNVLFHTINTVLLYGILNWIINIRARESRKDTSTSESWAQQWLIISLVIFWAWHPLRVEPVAWSTALHYNVATFFLLGSLLSLLAYYQFNKLSAAVCSITLLACSNATYPPAITWPLAIPFFWLILNSKGGNWRSLSSEFRTSIRACAPIFIPSLLISGAFLSLTLIGRFMGKSAWYSNDYAQAKTAIETGVIERLLNGMYSGSGLVQRMFLPLELSPAWPPDKVLTVTIISTIIVFLVISLFFFATLKRTALVSVCLVTIGITAVPVLGFTENSFYQPDRYAHILQLVMVVVLVSALPLKVINSFFSYKPVGRGITLITLGLTLAALNIRQQGIWTNSYTLFNHLENVSWVKANEERLHQVQCLRARKLTADKYYTAAASIYEPLLKQNPNPYYVTYFASINYMLMGNIERALELAEDAARLDSRAEIVNLLHHLTLQSKELAQPVGDSTQPSKK